MAARRVTAKTNLRRPRSNGHGIFSPVANPPAVLSPPQDLPILGRQCAEDRLQGRAALAALRLRTWKDRAEPHYRGLRQEAARVGARHQACALPRAVAVRDQVTQGANSE